MLVLGLNKCQRPLRLGIFVSNGWKEAYVVPIPVKEHIAAAVTVDCLATEHWVGGPSCEDGRSWCRITKVTEGYGLFYHASKPRPTAIHSGSDAPGGGLPITIVEMVADVLFVKLRDGAVINVEDADVVEVLRNIQQLL